jgi:leucyl-tRNA synthetase
MLSDSPPERDLPWSEAGIEGCARFVQRLWRLFAHMTRPQGEDKALDRKVHQTVHAVAQDIEALGFNKAVARIYELTGATEKAAPRPAAVPRSARCCCCRADDAASGRGSLCRHGAGLVADAAWPAVDPALLVDDEVTVAVQVKGKLRDTLTVAKGTAREDLEALALASDKVQRALDGAAVKKVIVVPDRLVNLVV